MSMHYKKVLCFVEQNGRGFDGSRYTMKFLLPDHSMGEDGSLGIMFKRFCMSVKKMPKEQGDREQQK